MNRQTRRFRRLLLLALAILLAAVLAPLLATHDPYASVLKDALQPPGGAHWFGTDSLGRDLFVKGPEPLDQGGPPLYDHEAADLLNALRDISVRSERRLPPPLSSFGEIVRQEHYPVSQKAWDILERLKLGVTSFRLLFWGSRSRSEVVAVFLAVLELCKARVVRLAGGEKDWTVTPTGESAEGLKL